jgi:hypothetical protein
LIEEYLHTLPPDEIVCFIDAYDVIIVQSPEIIENRFNNIIKNLIIT